MRRWMLLFLSLFAGLSLYGTLAAYLGLPHPPLLTPVTTLSGFAFSFLHGWRRLGWKGVFVLWALSFGVSLLFESVGVATGWVYGPYHYTDKLGVKFLGLVPLLIPAAWFMMMYPSYLIAERLISPDHRRRWVAIPLMGGIVMTAWDLAMDPMMVGGGHWVWEVDGAYFGIPLQNFWGWWLTTFVTFLLFWASSRPLRPTPSLEGDDHLVVVLYVITGLSSILVDFRVGLGGPAMVGLFAMLPWAWLSWQRITSRGGSS